MYRRSFRLKLTALNIGPYLAHEDGQGALYFDRATVAAISQDALAAALGARYLNQSVQLRDPAYAFELYTLAPDGALAVEHWVKRGLDVKPVELEFARAVAPAPTAAIASTPPGS
jgi:hypothetical protein